MKKIYALMAAGLMTAAASAQDYKEAISLEVLPMQGYASVEAFFDMEAVFEALGTDYLDENNVCYYNEEGELIVGRDGFTANNGYWYNMEGVVSPYGESSFFAEYNEGCDWVDFGQMPGVFEGGETMAFKFYFTNEGKVAELDIDVKILVPEKIQAEKVFGATARVELEEGDVSYSGTPVEVDYAAIAEAIGCDLMDATVVSYKANGDITDTLTGNNGFWFSFEGFPCNYADGVVYGEYWAEDGYIAIGQYPERLEAGDEVKLVFGFMNEGKLAEVEITVVIKEGVSVADGQIVATQNVVMEDMEAENTYAIEMVPVDADAVEAAIGCPMTESILVAYVDGVATKKYTGGGVEFWYDKEGNVGNWGDDASIYVGLNEEGVYVGQMPNAFVTGGTVTVVFGFYNEDKIAVVNLTYSVPGEGFGAAVSSIASEGAREVYNLQGMKMNAEQLPAGLYIINGKKVIVK